MSAPARRPSPAKPPARGSDGPRFGVERIVVLRVAIAVVAVAFLYLILKVSMIAFGGSSAREAKRIEHAVDPNAARRAADAAVPSQSESAPAR